MTAWLIIGAGIGLGLAILLLGLAPARMPLSQALAVLRHAPPPRPAGRARLWHALAAPARALGLPTTGMAADLAICERDPAQYLASQAGLVLLGLLTPAATVTALDAMGAHIGLATPLWVGAALAAGGYAVADLGLHSDAQDRRRQMRHTLAALLDVVPPALAAGAGVEQALTDAASIADGWAADRIRRALALARLTRVPLWQPLRDLGGSTGVVQLEQLAGTLQLAAGEGTRIREALIHRGEALSEHMTSEMEAAAEAATERMSIPLMALAAVFLLFLIYPAMAAFTA